MIIKLCGIALLTAAAALAVKQLKPELAVMVSVGGCIIILMTALPTLVPQLDYITELISGQGVSGYVQPLVKALGIALIAQTSAELCRDMGESSAASKIELAGKAEIMLLCLPLIGELLALAKSMLA